MRFYGFSADEITGNDGNLSTEYDPKCAWALRNLHLFPVEINTAPYQMLVRIPGIGIRNATRIFEARKFTNLDYDDLKRMKVVLKRAKHFITCKGKFYGSKHENNIKNLMITAEIQENAKQLSFFDIDSTALSALTGEL
jgi:predicted DNA-binding helix-hairpin-helix protein